LKAHDAPTTATLGVWSLVCLVIANMIGAGVFQSSGFSLAALGNPGRVMLAWSICGLWAISGALAYGALVSRLPISGGEYLFLSRFVHPSVGFLAGWISLIAGFTAPIALAAKGAASYGVPGVSELTHNEIAAGVILVSAICYLAGISVGARVQNSIVAFKLVMLVIIILVALSQFRAWRGGAPLPGRDADWMPVDLTSWSIMFGSMSWLALSYTGFNAAVYVAGESKDAARLVPRAMLLGTMIVTVLYLSLNFVFVYSVAPETVAGSFERVAAVVSREVGGPWLERAMQFTITLAMITSVFSMLMAGPRVYQKMAQDGTMPRWLDGQGRTPILATVMQAALSIIAVFAAKILELMKYLGLTLSVCGVLAVVSLWWVRRKLPDTKPLAWWEHLSTALYVMITVAILWGASSQQPNEFMAMLITFGIGIVVFIAAKAARIAS
jgi:amino acid transporter